MEDQVRQHPVEESINQRQRKPICTDRVRQSTINMHRQRATIRKSAYLLTVGNLAFDIQYGGQYRQSNNNRQIKLSTPKSKTAKI